MSVLVDFADWSELVLLHALHVFGAANAPINPALLSLNLSANMAELARRTNVNVHNPVSILLPATFNHLSLLSLTIKPLSPLRRYVATSARTQEDGKCGVLGKPLLIVAAMKINLMRRLSASINQDGLFHDPLVLFDWFFLQDRLVDDDEYRDQPVPIILLHEFRHLRKARRDGLFGERRQT